MGARAPACSPPSTTPLPYFTNMLVFSNSYPGLFEYWKSKEHKSDAWHACMGVAGAKSCSLVCVGCVFVGGKCFSYIYCDTKD